MKGLAFVKDPDGYLVEILPQGPMITKQVDCAGVEVSATECCSHGPSVASQHARTYVQV